MVINRGNGALMDVTGTGRQLPGCKPGSSRQMMPGSATATVRAKVLLLLLLLLLLMNSP